MSRFQKIAEKLDDYDIDAMLVTSKPNRLYTTGFASSAGMAIVTHDSSYFFIDSRYIEAAGKQIHGAEIRLSTADTSEIDLASETLDKHHIKRLGFEESYTTMKIYNRWTEKFHGCELVPAAEMLTNLRMVKEPSEIESMIAAQRIAEKALADVLDFIKPGRTEKEISAFLQYRMLTHGAEKMSFEPIVVSGPNSSLPHGVPSERPVGEGEFLTMDFGCVYHGYCSDMTRTVAIGYVTDEMERVYQTVLEAQENGISTAHGGVTGKAVHEAAAKVIADAGYGEYFGHGFGHSLGVEIHEDPRFSTSNDKPVPVGATLSAEPGIYLPGRFGVRIEDVILVGETESHSIMKAPKYLQVIK